MLTAAAIAAVATTGLTVPAFADDPPPPVWNPTPYLSVTTPDYEIDVTLGTSTVSVGDNRVMAEPMPVFTFTIENLSAETAYFGLAMDVDVAGQLVPFWQQSTWAPVGGTFDEAESLFVAAVEPGQTYDGFANVIPALPAWSGRTIGFYEITLDPPDGDPETPDTFTTGELAASTTLPGRFVPVRFTGSDDTYFGVEIGSPTSVTAPGGKLFPGAVATVTAADLTPGDELEMWLVKGADHFWFYLTMAALPADAIPVGSDTVAADGTFTGEFAVPLDTPLGSDYQLVLGNADENYWPAGGYTYFDIGVPDAMQSEPTADGASTTTVSVGLTDVSFAFPEGTIGGETTVTVSSTGPAPDEFTFLSNPPVFYYLDTTAVPGGPVTVCITYDTANFPGDVPWLYHHAPAGAGNAWTNITTSREPGLVCGVTSSFSPFAFGYPLVVDDGSVAPPAKGTLVSDNLLRDSDYTVTWYLRSGENASTVRLFENGTLVGEEAIGYGGQATQRATFPLSNKPNGTYVYTAELENSRGVTTTSALTVKVTNALPAKPLLLHDNFDLNGKFTLSAVLLLGTNASSYRFLEGATVVSQGQLTARTPLPQLAQANLSGVSKGSHTYRVEFTNHMGTTTSNSVTVKVK